MAKKIFDEIEIIKEISSILKDQNLSEIEIEREGVKIRVQNQGLQASQANQILSLIHI